MLETGFSDSYIERKKKHHDYLIIWFLPVSRHRILKSTIQFCPSFLQKQLQHLQYPDHADVLKIHTGIPTVKIKFMRNETSRDF